MAEETKEEQPEGLRYFEERMAELGIDPDKYLVNRPLWESSFSKEKGEDPKGYEPLPVFERRPDGSIKINYFTREGIPATYYTKGVKSAKHYSQVRHIPGTVNKKGEPLRYTIPRGAGTAPFIPPGLVEKYNRREQITTLVLTEGAFKAAKGDQQGLDIIGLPSITHYRSSETKDLHFDIRKIVEDCKVQRIVWLHDGDARRLSQDFPEINPEKDLYQRPNQFYRTVWTVKNLFNDFTGLSIYYAVVKSEGVEGDPKGLDDLYTTLEELYPAKFNENSKQIREEINGATENATFFHKFDVTTKMEDVRKWYRLDNVNAFYRHHEGKIRDKEFIFHGTKYRWDKEKDQCEVLIPAETKDYVRVGTDYYKWINKPTVHGIPDRVLVRWSKPTIVEDYGKDFAKHITKLNDFCNVPDHVDFNPIISNCYNVYQPFKWVDRDEGEWETIKTFLEHIFGNEDITHLDPKTKKEVTVNSLQLGLDYMQLLYKKPTQKLPILCLVSQEKETGKSTFGKLLKEIFTQNAVFVGNSDLSNDFNSSWSTKLLIMCEEVLIDKKLQMEKIKNLATNDKIMMNSKGKDQKEMDFYGKFLFMSNNEKNFITTDKDETRFWVRKIPKLTAEQKNPNLMEEMYEEIPAFLHMLDKRKMATQKRTRSWFATSLIRTEALQKIVDYSQPTIEKEIRNKMTQLFELEEGRQEILMATKEISKEFFRGNKYEHNYIEDSCANMGVERFENGGKVKRYRYPVLHEHFDSSELTWKVSVIEKPGIGRPFLFKRDEFMGNDLEYELEELPTADKFEKEGKQMAMPVEKDDDDGSDDLPF